MQRVLQIFFVILVMIITVLPLHAEGTVDVLGWLSWIALIERDGLVLGYANSELVYPPLTWVILQGVTISAHAFNMEMFLALKWWLVASLFLTSGIFLLWTRNLLLTTVFHFSLLLGSVALGYLDIWMSPTLLLAFWALKARKTFLFTVFFTISILIKWQPMIIGPFLVAYILREAWGIARWKAMLKVFLRDLALPAGLLAGGTLLIFGQPMLLALQIGMSHTVLSGNALNYNWIVTYILRLTQPDRFGPIGGFEGVIGYIDLVPPVSDWEIVGVPRFLFILFYGIALVVMLRRPKSFENLLQLVIVGYFAYFMFNIGVHENHLYLSAFLAFIVCWLNPKYRYNTLILALIVNVNILLFYGFTGLVYPYNRQIFIDISLPLSIFNVLFFLVLWTMACFRKEPNPARAITETGIEEFHTPIPEAPVLASD